MGMGACGGSFTELIQRVGGGRLGFWIVPGATFNALARPVAGFTTDSWLRGPDFGPLRAPAAPSSGTGNNGEYRLLDQRAISHTGVLVAGRQRPWLVLVELIRARCTNLIELADISDCLIPSRTPTGPREAAGALSNARACAVVDCSANCAGWQVLQAWAVKSPMSKTLLPDESAAVLELPPVDSAFCAGCVKDGSAGYGQVRIGPTEAVGDVVAFRRSSS